MGKRICSFPDCGKTGHARDLCPGHYQQHRRGDELHALRQASPCQVPDCETGGTYYTGYCRVHADRIHRLGTPHLPPKPTLAQRFWAKVDKTDTCWLWTGARHFKGYGQIWDADEKRLLQAIRVSLELAGRPPRDDQEVDHLCRVPRCIRPDHLEAVSHAENMRRAPFTAIQFQAAKTHCPQGHEYTPENTRPKINSSGGISRECRTCLAEAQRRYRARKRAGLVGT